MLPVNTTIIVMVLFLPSYMAVVGASRLSRLVDWLRLLRAGNGLVIGFGAITGYFVGGGSNTVEVIVLFLSAMLIGFYGNVVNDIFDVDVDRISKPWRPLASGKISLRTARFAALLLALSGLSLAFAINVSCFIVAVFAVFMLYVYSRWAKKAGLPGNLLIALLSLLVVVYGGLAAPNPPRALLPGIYAFLIILGREVLKGIEDIEGDRRYGVYTVAVRYGVRWALGLGSLLLLAVVVLSPLPYMYAGFNLFYLAVAVFGVDIPIIVALGVLFTDPLRLAWRATRLLKISLVMGLLAFLVGA